MPESVIYDHYEVLTRDDGSFHELGRGAMGITYKAFDINLRVPVALKVINAALLDSDVARQRFIREARSAAQLRHRHVASVFHLGMEGDTWFYAMEFIDGETLDALIKRQGPLSAAAALTVAAQVARALNAAAQHGLVHRDIKPANLMLVKEDDEIIAKVIDFGLAKTAIATEGEDAVTLSMGGFVGTPHFASPEQLEERETDTRTDIYSLGVTLWYMLAGHTPFGGSMAQVMSQHLTKPPPFAKLDGVPPPVADLLRKMLAKDPADRPQTPAELRKDIESAMEKISHAEPAGETADRHGHTQALLEESEEHAGFASFETNSIIAHRYRMVESRGENNAGRIFRAFDTVLNCEVRIVVFHPQVLGDSAALTTLESEVERLTSIEHPNLLRVLGFETVDRGSFLVLEWTEGFTLLELLKARRQLETAEALQLLQQAAQAVDQAVALDLKGLDLALHQWRIHFPGAIDKEKVLHLPLRDWPAFTLKLYPIGLARDFGSSQTWVGGQTMVAGAGHKAPVRAGVRPQYIQALAAIVYELVGCAPSAVRPDGSAANYTPLATLSEEGNEVLRCAMDAARSFPSAQEFYGELVRWEGSPGRRHEVKSPLTIPPVEARPRPPMPPPAPPKKKAQVLLFGGFALCVIAAVGLAIFFHGNTNAPGNEAPAASEPLASTTTMPPPATPEALATRSNVVPATPVPVIPAATPPGPTRQELLAKSVAAAQSLEDNNDWPNALTAWLEVVKNYPESPAGKNHLETFLNHLRDRPSPITPAEFSSLRDQIVESAQLGIVSAMLLLGDNLRKTEAQTAAHWFGVAADEGNPIAQTQLGFMLSQGFGADHPDLARAVACFQAAAAQGDIAGKFALGQAYRFGRGVVKDEKRAVELFREAADAGETRAMNDLGDCYVHAIGVERNYEAAFQLFSKAEEKGNLNATGNLGVLYMNGDGVTADPKRAAELFAKGAKAGDDFCMLLYAQCLETGRGIPRNTLQATAWFRKAAEAGNKRAQEWCDAHAIPWRRES